MGMSTEKDRILQEAAELLQKVVEINSICDEVQKRMDDFDRQWKDSDISPSKMDNQQAQERLVYLQAMANMHTEAGDELVRAADQIGLLVKEEGDIQEHLEGYNQALSEELSVKIQNTFERIEMIGQVVFSEAAKKV